MLEVIITTYLLTGVLVVALFMGRGRYDGPVSGYLAAVDWLFWPLVLIWKVVLLCR